MSPGHHAPHQQHQCGIVQLVERLTLTQEVAGSSPATAALDTWLNWQSARLLTGRLWVQVPLYPLFQDSGGGRAPASYAEGYGIPRRARSSKHGIPRMPATRSWDYYLIILIERFSNLSTTGLYTMELISNTIYMRKGISLLITWYKKRNEY